MPVVPVYVGLAAVTAATLFAEIVLTRIFSVTLWYHFAFVAISLAMLGMSGGTMAVYLQRHRYPPERALRKMARLTAYLGSALVLAYILNLGVGFRPSPHPAAAVSLGLIVGFWAVPFFLSGMIVSVALTRSLLPTGRLYAVDLAGAALGCLMVQPVLAALGPPAGIGVASLLLILVAEWMAAAAGVNRREGLTRRALGMAALALFIAGAVAKPDLFSPRWVKGNWEPRRERIYWNAYSRVAVYPPETAKGGKGRGLGFRLPTSKVPLVEFRKQDIDATSTTWITRFDGDLRKHWYLAYDAVNIAYHLRTGGSVAVIGAGGGRDILAALVMGQREVTGIEMNAVLVRLLQKDFAEYSGNLATWPGVQLQVAEARNWLERCGRQFDVIQISFTDTWAAASSGAFALTENNLYTVEGWLAFFDRLKPDGILSVSRYYSTAAPMEAYRLAAIAQAALTARGQSEPGRCVAIVSNAPPGEKEELGTMATLVVSPSPLSAQDCEKLDEVAARVGFQVVYSPRYPQEPFAQILDPARSQAWQRSYFLDVTAPRDDRPYFLFVLRLRDLLSPQRLGRMFTSELTLLQSNFVAVIVLAALGVVLVGAAVLMTLVPLSLKEGRGVWRPGDGAAALYFAAIGLGFMMVEMAVIQRSGVMLGHPIYGLQVTLFSLLLGSGLGSYLSSLLPGPVSQRAPLLVAGPMVASALAVLGLAPLGGALSSAVQPVRIAVVAALVLTLGLFMGVPFPTGLGVCRARGREALLPWLWGVNGVCSVVGALLGTVCSIFAGARTTGLAGAGLYLLAWVAVVTLVRARTALPAGALRERTVGDTDA